MSDLIVPRDHLSFTSTADVCKICQSFFERHQINCFSYSRVYPDGSRAELWSHPQALEHTFFTKKYIVGAYTPNYFSAEEKYSLLQHKVVSYPGKWRQRFIQQLADQRNIFDHDHCFMLLNKEQRYTEYFIFYTSTKIVSAVNFYFNNLDLLEQFSRYFKWIAADLIEAVDEHRLIPSRKSTAVVDPVDSQHTIKIHHCLHLTMRERQIAQLMTQGKTAYEIGLLLNRSLRTIEAHINNMKIKLGCNKRSQLIAAFIELGLVNFTDFH